jgi:hypothetical protein
MEIEKIIDCLIDSKVELSEKIEIWKEQRFKVKTNEEFFFDFKTY